MEWKNGYVIVGVDDLDRAIGFYSDTLGFALQHAAPDSQYAAFDAGGMNFSIVGAHGDSFTGRHTGIGFHVADVDAAHAELVAKGVVFTMEPSKQPWGGYMAMFADPDGNTFYLDEAHA